MAMDSTIIIMAAVAPAELHTINWTRPPATCRSDRQKQQSSPVVAANWLAGRLAGRPENKPGLCVFFQLLLRERKGQFFPFNLLLLCVSIYDHLAR